MRLRGLLPKRLHTPKSQRHGAEDRYQLTSPDAGRFNIYKSPTPLIDRIPTAVNYDSDESASEWIEERSRCSRYSIPNDSDEDELDQEPELRQEPSSEDDGDDRYSTSRSHKNNNNKSKVKKKRVDHHRAPPPKRGRKNKMTTKRATPLPETIDRLWSESTDSGIPEPWKRFRQEEELARYYNSESVTYLEESGEDPLYLSKSPQSGTDEHVVFKSKSNVQSSSTSSKRSKRSQQQKKGLEVDMNKSLLDEDDSRMEVPGNASDDVSRDEEEDEPNENDAPVVVAKKKSHKKKKKKKSFFGRVLSPRNNSGSGSKTGKTTGPSAADGEGLESKHHKRSKSGSMSSKDRSSKKSKAKISGSKNSSGSKKQSLKNNQTPTSSIRKDRADDIGTGVENVVSKEEAEMTQPTTSLTNPVETPNQIAFDKKEEPHDIETPPSKDATEILEELATIPSSKVSSAHDSKNQMLEELANIPSKLSSTSHKSKTREKLRDAPFPKVSTDSDERSETSSLTDPLALLATHGQTEKVVKEIEKKLKILKEVAKKEKIDAIKQKKMLRQKKKKAKAKKFSKKDSKTTVQTATKSKTPKDAVVSDLESTPRAENPSTKTPARSLFSFFSNTNDAKNLKTDDEQASLAEAEDSHVTKAKSGESSEIDMYTKSLLTEVSEASSPRKLPKTKQDEGQASQKSADHVSAGEKPEMMSYVKSMATQDSEEQEVKALSEKKASRGWNLARVRSRSKSRPKSRRARSRSRSRSRAKSRTRSKEHKVSRSRSWVRAKKRVEERVKDPENYRGKSSSTDKDNNSITESAWGSKVSNVMDSNQQSKGAGPPQELDEYSIKYKLSEEDPALVQCLQFYSCGALADKVGIAVKTADDCKQGSVCENGMEIRQDLCQDPLTPKPNVEVVLDESMLEGAFRKRNPSAEGLDEAPELTISRASSYVMDVSEKNLHLDEDSFANRFEEHQAEPEPTDVSITTIDVPIQNTDTKKSKSPKTRARKMKKIRNAFSRFRKTTYSI